MKNIDVDSAMREARVIANDAGELAFRLTSASEYLAVRDAARADAWLAAFTARLDKLGLIIIEAGLVPDVVRIRALSSDDPL